MKVKTSVAVVVANGSSTGGSHNFYLNQQYAREYERDAKIEILGKTTEDYNVYGLWGSIRGGTSEQMDAIAAIDRLEMLEDKLRGEYANKPLRNKVPLIRDYLARLNNINCLNTRDVNLKGAGIPIAVLTLLADKALLINMGGSKIYLYRNSLCYEPEEAGDANDALPLELQKGDILLTCSEGMMEFISQAEVTQALANDDSSVAIANRLTEIALANGSRGSLTAMVIKVDDIAQGKGRQRINLQPIKKYSAIVGVAILGGMLLAGGFALAQNILAQRTAGPGQEIETEQEPSNPSEEIQLITSPEPEPDMDPAPEQVPDPDPAPVAGSVSPPSEQYDLRGNYEVQPGDTLYGISIQVYQRNAVEEIKRFNNMTSDAISVGQIIKLPVLN